jgi:hypothetical protein
VHVIGVDRREGTNRDFFFQTLQLSLIGLQSAIGQCEREGDSIGMQKLHVVHGSGGHFSRRLHSWDMLGDERGKAAAQGIIDAAGSARSDREPGFYLGACHS